MKKDDNKVHIAKKKLFFLFFIKKRKGNAHIGLKHCCLNKQT